MGRPSCSARWTVTLPANLAPECRAAEAAYGWALLIASKADRLADPESDLQLRAFPELEALDCPALAASAETGFGPGTIGPWLFSSLGIVRMYAKRSGGPTDCSRPFTVRAVQTVEDVARPVHRDLAQSLKYARMQGKSGFEGQHVGREHHLADGDIVELHP
ncbi:MAG: TGS domain-containing protein [Pseudomonadota bacterium]|jgi:ribosome-interacting GTPase 1